MKKYLFVIILLLFGFNADAANTPPPGANGNYIYNNNGQWGATTNQQTLNNIFTTPIQTIAPVVTLCDGSGDESAFNAAMTSAHSLKTQILVGNGCQPANQIAPVGTNTYNSFFGWGGASTDPNTAGSVQPRISVFSSGVAANAPGASAFDLHGPSVVSFNNLNFFGQDISQIMSLFENSIQNGSGSAPNAFQFFNSSAGQTNTVLGCPMDGNLNCVKVNGVRTATLTSGGSGYVDGTYNKVALTGGSGSAAFADEIIVSGGIVTSVILNDGSIAGNGIVYPGTNYAINDVLSAANSDLGGSGSGLSLTVTGLTKATPTAANTLPRAMKSQFSDVGGCVFCLNDSDDFLWGDEISGVAGVVMQPIFGGGGRIIGPMRVEFSNKGFWLGGPNSSTGNGATIINSVGFDVVGQNYDTNYRTTGHQAIEIDSGDGYTMVGDMISRPNIAGPSFQFGGTGANKKLTGVMVSGTVWSSSVGTSHETACMEVMNGGDGTAPDFLWLNGICHPGNDAPAVKYDVVPLHFVEDTIASEHATDSTFTGVGQHWERGRPWGIGNTPPSTDVTMDLGQDTKALWLPTGTTAQRPTVHAGEIRYNSDTPGVEAYYNSTWNTLGTSGSVSLNATTSNLTYYPILSATSTSSSLSTVYSDSITVSPPTGTLTLGNLNISNTTGSIQINSFPVLISPDSGGNSVLGVGIGALEFLGTVQANNTAIGSFSIRSLQSGTDNTALGQSALFNMTTGSQNVAIGSRAMFNAGANVESDDDTFVGYNSGGGQFGSSFSTGVGDGVLSSQTSGNFNTAFGYLAGHSLTTGNSNVVIGPNVASTTLSIGSNNILIGTTSGLDVTTSSTSNFISIGNVLEGTTSGGGYFVEAGATATVTSGATACGTSPTISGNNNVGSIVIGSSPSGSCPVVFGVAWTNPPDDCSCNDHTSAVRTCAVLSMTTTSIALTASTTPFTGADQISYKCTSHRL